MTVSANERLRRTWLAIFERKGAIGIYTRCFEDVMLTEQRDLLQRIEMGAGELPVIASINGANNWLLLTTNQIVWCLAGMKTALAISDILRVRVDLGKLAGAGLRKAEMTELVLETIKGEVHVIVMERGAPLFGVWHILKNIEARNRRACSGD